MVRIVAVGVAVAILALGASAAAAPEAVWVDPVGAPDIAAKYSEAQSSLTLCDDEKIAATIESYLAAKARGYSLGQPVDFEFLTDRTTEAGQSLYEYELGRETYTLLCWRYTGMMCTGCEYTSSLLAVHYATDGAVCEAEISGRTIFSHDPEPMVFLKEKHSFELLRGGDGFWRLTSDTYRDEFRDCYPPGTDFRTLAESMAARYDAWSKTQYAGQGPGDDRSKAAENSLKVVLAVVVVAVLLPIAAIWLWSRRRRASRKC